MFGYSNIYMRATLIALAAAAVGGCELLYYLGGPDKKDALYTFPKDKSVLVLVDVRPEVSVPPTFATTLSDQIASHLYRTKAIDRVARQEPLIQLQQNPDAYAKMGVADIAKATGADLVVVIYITEMAITISSDVTVIQGTAQAQVKIVTKDGTRMWPGDETGQKVEAHVDPTFMSDHSRQDVYKQLTAQFTKRIGRMFHAYDPDDKELRDPRG